MDINGIKRGDQSGKVLQKKGFITKNTNILTLRTFPAHSECFILLFFTEQVEMALYEIYLYAAYS